MRNFSHNKYIKLFLIPGVLLAIYLLMALVWWLMGWPSGDKLIDLVKGYFRQYGLWIVFIGALIEGFFLLGQYFPGGTIIFLGVISADKDIPRVVEVVSIVSVAFFIAYALNYLLGKYGWYRLLVRFGLRQSLDTAKQKLERQGLSAVVLSYWEPNLASIIATAAGTLQIPLLRFELYSVLGITLWNIFWGMLVFFLGTAALQMMGLKFVLIVFVIWVSVIVVKARWFAKS